MTGTVREFKPDRFALCAPEVVPLSFNTRFSQKMTSLCVQIT